MWHIHIYQVLKLSWIQGDRSIAIRRALLERIGGLPEHTYAREDWDIWAQAGRNGRKGDLCQRRLPDDRPPGNAAEIVEAPGALAADAPERDVGAPLRLVETASRFLPTAVCVPLQCRVGAAYPGRADRRINLAGNPFAFGEHTRLAFSLVLPPAGIGSRGGGGLYRRLDLGRSGVDARRQYGIDHFRLDRGAVNPGQAKPVL